MHARMHLHGRRGVDLLHDPVLNKGTAFTEAERSALGLRGLLPPRPVPVETQLMRVLENIRRKPDDLERYIFLFSLLDRNETLFYRVVMDHLEELMPVIYTPTVGQGCQEYGHIIRRPRGLYISLRDQGRVKEILQNWPEEDVRVIVVTDGERILGLGDLGANGIGIPIGKLSLYTACAGVQPTQTLPVVLDVGTDNEELLADPLYIGEPMHRARGPEYDELVEEFFVAANDLFPDVCIQLEDFGNRNAFRLLARYRERYCVFDDDIQGTAAVALAGIVSSLRLTTKSLREQRFLFLGAGEAGVGIADLIVTGLVSEGLDRCEAMRRCCFYDSRGLVCSTRTDLAEHKRPYAHDLPACATFLEAVEALAPTAIIGVSGVPQTFTEPVVRAMARLNQRPILFALSNPTSKAECTAEQAYRWTDGRAVFASGSPFPAVEYGGRRYVPGQGNNAYIFPGVGLGLVVSRARRATDAMFFAAARELANLVSDEDLAIGRVYPGLDRIRDVSLNIAVAVADLAWQQGLSRLPRPDDLARAVREAMYEPVYPEYA